MVSRQDARPWEVGGLGKASLGGDA